MAGVAKQTVLELLEDADCAAAVHHHRNVRDLRVRRLQCDEIWAFCGAKAKKVTLEQKAASWCDVVFFHSSLHCCEKALTDHIWTLEELIGLLEK